MEEKEIDILEPKSQLTWCDWAKEGLKVPKVLWRRMNHNGHRYYFAKDGDNLMIGAGITTVIDRSFGESPFLREWKDARPNWKEDLRLMADFGVLNHIGFEQLLKEGMVSSDVISITDKRFKKKTQFKRNMLSLVKFIKDYNVQPLFIEGILGKEYVSKNGNKSYINSAIDLFCQMDMPIKTKVMIDDGEYVRGDKKGQMKQKEVTNVTFETIYAIVDLKSNYDDKDSKSFFDSHKYQLIFGRQLILDNFDVKDVRMFNISPLGWKTEPKYVLTEHKDTVNYYGYSDSDILSNRINTAIIEQAIQPKGQIFEISDEINIDNTNYRTVSYEELAEEYIQNLENNLG